MDGTGYGHGCMTKREARHNKREARAEIREARLQTKADHAAERGRFVKASRLQMKADKAHGKAEHEHRMANMAGGTACSNPPVTVVTHVTVDAVAMPPVQPPPAYLPAAPEYPAYPTAPSAPVYHGATPPAYTATGAHQGTVSYPDPGAMSYPNPYK